MNMWSAAALLPLSSTAQISLVSTAPTNSACQPPPHFHFFPSLLRYFLTSSPHPPQSPAQQHRRQDHSPIRRRNSSHRPKYNHVPNQHQHWRNQNDEERPIHRLFSSSLLLFFSSSFLLFFFSFFLRYIITPLLHYVFLPSLRHFPGLYCARLVSVSHKITSVTRAPAGKSCNPAVTSS